MQPHNTPFPPDGQYVQVLTNPQWVTLRNQGAFAGLNLQVDELDNGDHKVILSPDEYKMFQTNASQPDQESVTDIKVTITSSMCMPVTMVTITSSRCMPVTMVT